MADFKVGRIEQLTHTPGPWTPMVDAGGFRPFVVAPAPSGSVHRITVADCPHPADALWSHQRIANARLIAAAPELLLALKAILDCEQIDGVGGGRIRIELDYRSPLAERARAAIAKAEGRP